jgi:hypothetical protein
MLRLSKFRKFLLHVIYKRQRLDPNQRTVGHVFRGRGKILRICAPGIKLGFEISHKEKATMAQRRGGRVSKKSKKENY